MRTETFFGEAVGDVATLRGRVSEELGCAMGFASAVRFAVATPSGVAVVDSGRTPHPGVVSELRRALAAAVRDIDEHNAEYRHVTPKAKLEEWRRLSAE